MIQIVRTPQTVPIHIGAAAPMSTYRVTLNRPRTGGKTAMVTTNSNSTPMAMLGIYLIAFGTVGGLAQTSASAGARNAPDRPTNEALQLTVQQLPSPPRPKEPVIETWEGLIEVTIRNMSKRAIRLNENALTYELMVWDASGN